MKNILLIALLIGASSICTKTFAQVEIRFGAYDAAAGTVDVLLLNAPNAAVFDFDISGATKVNATPGNLLVTTGWFFLWGPGGVVGFNATGVFGQNEVRLATVEFNNVTGPICIQDVVLGDISGVDIPFTIGDCLPNSTCDATVPPADLKAELLGGGSNWELSWATTANSIGCRIAGKPTGAPSESYKIAAGFQTSSAIIPGAVLSPGTTYEFRVQCACSLSPFTATPFSPTSTFTVPSPRLAETLSTQVYPNPAADQFIVEGKGAFSIYGMDGRLMHMDGKSAQNEAKVTRQLSVSDWPAGLYSIIFENGQSERFEIIH